MSRSPVDARIKPHKSGGTCQAEGCENDELLATVEPDDSTGGRLLCPRHRVKYLREVNEQ